MEIKIKLKKIGDKNIYGDFLENRGARTLIIFLSGFSGGRESRLFKNSSKWFFRKGFSTFRFNFYDTSKRDSLKLEEMRLATYLIELKNIIDFFDKKYSNIVLVGHSLGSVISILFLEKYPEYAKNSRLVLWDPSILSQIEQWIKKYFKFNGFNKKYYLKRGAEKIVLSADFYNELLNTKETTDIFRSLNQKACIVGAEKGAKDNADIYYLKLYKKRRNSSVYSIIKKTGHLFGSKLAQKELFGKTIDFLKDLKK